jgi:ATP-dependent Clp protease, protease subunit
MKLRQHDANLYHRQPVRVGTKQQARLKNDTDSFTSDDRAASGLLQFDTDIETLDKIPFVLAIGTDINDNSAQELTNQLTGMERWYYSDKGKLDPAKLKDRPIRFVINSNGGYCSSVLALLDKIEDLKAKGITIATYVSGKAFSGGAVLASAGTKGHRYIAPRAAIMLHQAQIPGGEADAVSVHDAKSNVDFISHQNTMLLTALHQHLHGKTSKAKLEKDTQNDFYLTAEEAIAYGLADSIGHVSLN